MINKNNIDNVKVKNNTGNKSLSVIALVVATLCLAVGFAAYSSTLVINSNVNVAPNENIFKVGFSTLNNNIVEGSVSPKKVGNFNADSAVLTETTVTGLNVTFTEPGQTVNYEFYVDNVGAYDAYLNDIIFKNATGCEKNKVCVASSPSDQALVDEVCEHITLGIRLTGSKLSFTDYKYTSLNNISNEILRKDSYANVVVSISYLNNNVLIDKPFTVKFGDIVLNFSAVD